MINAQGQSTVILQTLDPEVGGCRISDGAPQRVATQRKTHYSALTAGDHSSTQDTQPKRSPPIQKESPELEVAIPTITPESVLESNPKVQKVPWPSAMRIASSGLLTA